MKQGKEECPFKNSHIFVFYMAMTVYLFYFCMSCGGCPGPVSPAAMIIICNCSTGGDILVNHQCTTNNLFHVGFFRIIY